MTDGDNPFLERGRDEIELLEESELAPGAARAAASKGRDRFEEHDPRRTAFDRDRDRILHSKAFRRLKHKTQVFINPEDDHYVTRLTHTLQVTQIGRSLARYLSLNETLTEAICLGHDVGHSPFGHTGEEALSEYLGRDWIHSEQSVRIFNVLEPLNLTWEVLDGVRSHPWRIDPPPTTYEGRLCRYSDRIAYLAHDVQDALRAGVLTRDDMPQAAIETFGEPGRDWISSMMDSVVAESLRTGDIAMEPGRLDVMHQLRAFMFERVYLRPDMEPQRRRAKDVVHGLVEYFAAHPEDIPDTYRHDEADTMTQVIDYVAGMTDRFAVRTHDQLFRPSLFD